MPGLINLHVHLPASGKPTVKQKDPKKAVRLMTSNALLRAVTFQVCAKTELLSGVTTLRSVGGIQAVDSCLRDKILSGKAVGPRIMAGNMAVSVPGGHMAGSLAYEAASPEEAAALVRKIAEDKPDLVKLMITGGVLDAKCKGEPGKCADLIVTRANPLEDLKALRHIDLVMGRGNLIRAPKVKKIEKAERELDKFL